MSLGSIVLKVRQKYEHGWRTAHLRDTVRLRILNTPPITNTQDQTCEIHVFTCAKDWLNLIWTLKTFYHYSQRHYALCIHDDGTLKDSDRETLQHHFPNARLIDRPQADERVLAELQGYPHCLAFRQSNHLSPKIFDFAAYLQSDRMLLLDSDVLFFESPIALLERIEDPGYRFNSVNGDIKNAYTVDPIEVQRRCGITMVERFNSGLGLIHQRSLDLNWIEEFLQLPNIIGNFWLIEQTLYALCSSKFGVELLPDAYDVCLDEGIYRPSRHYVGKIRHLMYREGISHLVNQEFLQKVGT
jgi:hypothetical protein